MGIKLFTDSYIERKKIIKELKVDSNMYESKLVRTAHQ